MAVGFTREVKAILTVHGCTLVRQGKGQFLASKKTRSARFLIGDATVPHRLQEARSLSAPLAAR